ncbi:MAG: 5-deoxy-glucuronate isomerase [Meiothermus sp.]|uniref:5-deoxy-glucuronate isomerase n=1 Tax=Meiothermus sp. TaxID=1955249 RepID=UPI00263919CA|nr:5-deoxy-glucuronate isomerase [Meiothermus sp.]MCS7057995.1 5-deoxy-glucuronate isomerase [Meiothermus sp.]MDW8091950.1 5-deoxy-glucuronate isomerase [Meiothermus sp.]MDW8480401.1 5-deoxy-glucuronate isomerase [Meiothermus sp.]
MNHYTPRPGRVRVEVAPQGAWRYLFFRVLALVPGEVEAGATEGCEVALVPLSGRVRVEAGGQVFELARRDVFGELPSVLYLPPGIAYRIEALSEAELALGGAPAEGRYPLRLFRPEEMRVEMRGGGNALRQVSHILGPHLPAERLILYEVYTPSGHWSGWPPHRHDGRMGSLYIEETYYYKIRPAHGFAIHRNYSPEDGLDELLLAQDGDLILAPRGYHPVAAAPGSNVYYLNYMAGEAVGEARATPPVDDPDWAWMRQDWAGRPLRLPVGGEED